jgi:hypothetical protein
MYEDHGTTTDGSGFVFAWPDGRPIRPGWLTHRFIALVTEHGLPPIRLHDLRHGTAMNALHGSASLHTVPDALARREAMSTAETILTAMRQNELVDAPQHMVDVHRRRPYRV